jgi:hypothetical protein
VPRVRAISGAGGKGPACFLVETPGARLLLDLGYGPQPGVWPDLNGVGPVDAIVLTHGHQDHAGALRLANQVGRPAVYATAPVIPMLGTALETRELPLCGRAAVCGIEVRTGRNGHAPGGVWLHADIGGGLLYTGDYSVESLIYEYDPPPPAGTVILDASYGDYDAPLESCIAALGATFDAPASLLPVPPLGRGPEIACHLALTRARLPCIGEDLRAALGRMGGAPQCHGVRAAAAEVLMRIAREAPPLEQEEGALLTGAADGTSGEAAEFLARWETTNDRPIVFTGYLPPGTPAQRLTASGRARYMRWNVHPRLRDNAGLVRSTGARQVLPAFASDRYRGLWARTFAPARVAIQETIAL